MSCRAGVNERWLLRAFSISHSAMAFTFDLGVDAGLEIGAGLSTCTVLLI
jgi:hypothetical protein